jgi:hypothetical protein
MKNIVLAIILAVFLGLGFYFYNSNSHHSGNSHSHDGGESHSH